MRADQLRDCCGSHVCCTTGGGDTVASGVLATTRFWALLHSYARTTTMVLLVMCTGKRRSFLIRPGPRFLLTPLLLHWWSSLPPPMPRPEKHLVLISLSVFFGNSRAFVVWLWEGRVGVGSGVGGELSQSGGSSACGVEVGAHGHRPYPRLVELPYPRPSILTIVCVFVEFPARSSVREFHDQVSLLAVLEHLEQGLLQFPVHFHPHDMPHPLQSPHSDPPDQIESENPSCPFV